MDQTHILFLYITMISMLLNLAHAPIYGFLYALENRIQIHQKVNVHDSIRKKKTSKFKEGQWNQRTVYWKATKMREEKKCNIAIDRIHFDFTEDLFFLFLRNELVFVVDWNCLFFKYSNLHSSFSFNPVSIVKRVLAQHSVLISF